ncbi:MULTISPECIES: hypothetical protein [Paenibacillus]|uniref:hypothetical protein n=1 Tax=Paenibacillus TaxID=44249 RepID=UPI0022B8ADAB|nr:hypothetical protein [Paenibacillus caseinilyticus]MCZ8521831.1 hypothetical protein [Paenibacillus caseinilyticus]
MTNFKKIGVICVASAITVSGLWAANSFVSSHGSNTSANQSSGGEIVPLTPQDYENRKTSVAEIHNKYGVFKRAAQPGNFKPSEIANGEEQLNAETKQLVVSFGVFEKVSE